MDAQVNYLVHELATAYHDVDAVLRASHVSADDASDEVVYNFETPGALLDASGHKLPRTNPQVQQVFQARRRNAQTALHAYHGQP